MPIMRFPRGQRSATLCAIALFSVGGIGIAGCSDDDPASPAREFGTYALARVNDQSLPFTATTEVGTMVVQSATLTLTAAASGNPTYTATVQGTANGAPGTLLTDAGTYVASGGTLTFTSTVAPGVVYPGVVAGNVVTITVPGLVLQTTGTFSLRFEK
jgi:hypothetical protein